MAYLHVVLDMYDYEEILKVTKKEFRDESLIFLNLHMEMGAIAAYKDVQISPEMKFKQQLCPNLEIHCAILSFIQNYDGLYLGNDDLWYEQEVRKIERILAVAKSGQHQIVLWHRNSAESLCAFFYVVSILKPIVPRGSILEGVNLNREIKRLIYSKNMINETIEESIVERCTKPVKQGKDHFIDLEHSRLVFENMNMRIIHAPYQKPISTNYDYYDNFILSYYKSHPVKPEAIIKAIQNDVAGEQYLCTSFIIFRLCTLRDRGHFDIISKPSVLDMAKPTIFGDRWKLRKQKHTQNVEFDYDALKNLICSKYDDIDYEQQLEFLLHTILLNKKSKEFLWRLMIETEQVIEKNKLIVCLLVRFDEFITPTERIALLRNYQYSELTTEG